MPNMTQAEYEAFMVRQQRVSTAGDPPEVRLHDAINEECKRRGWIALHGSMAHRTHRTVGEPDFVILADNGQVLLVECKRKGGKLSTHQLALRAWAERLGHRVHIVHSLAEFLDVVALHIDRKWDVPQ